MGLDNGIIIRGKTEKGRAFLKNFYSDEMSDYRPGDYEPVYWRKNWNMRGRMLEIFEDNKRKDEWHIILSLFDLAIVVEKVLKYFLDENNWGDYGSSLWEWHVAVRSIGNQIFNLRDFLENAEISNIHNEDLEIYFYDSY